MQNILKILENPEIFLKKQEWKKNNKKIVNPDAVGDRVGVTVGDAVGEAVSGLGVL